MCSGPAIATQSSWPSCVLPCRTRSITDTWAHGAKHAAKRTESRHGACLAGNGRTRPPRTRQPRDRDSGRVRSPGRHRANTFSRRFVVRQGLRAARARAWLGLILAMLLNAAPAVAGPFARLQVLLPGETAAPGTSSGKTGTPNPQTAGIPFHVTVNACDASWTLVPSVTHTIRILSSDASASLPASAQLVGGTGDFLVILNAGGNFTIYAHDETDVTIPDGPSLLGSVDRAPEPQCWNDRFEPDRRRLFLDDDHGAGSERKSRERIHGHRGGG